MGELVSSIASTLLDKLATKAYQEIALACGLKGDVEKLEKSMKIIKAFLMDAENKQAKNRSIAEWLKQLTDAFDDAIDILDEIEYQSKRNEVVKMYGSTSTKVCRFFSFSNSPLTFRIKMAHKIRDVKQRIDEITNDGGKLGIVKQEDNATTPMHNLSWTETAPFVPPRVSGRNEEKEELISLLMRPQSEVSNIDVIPIVGIGGLGKTTLAQMVQNDSRVKQHFSDMLMWVCVSNDFDVMRLIFRIVKAASETKKDTEEVDPNSSLGVLLSLLDKKLHGRRFLLVLDDVWNENPIKWDELRNHLLRVSGDMKSKGSKIVVTTRSKTVASIMGSGIQIKLEPLPKKECWELFVKCAFQEEEKEAEQYPWLKEIGEDIVKKCKGVPLAIEVLGCLLKSKSHDANEWKKVRDSDIWELNPEDVDILPKLRLSYNHLLPEVKQCFSYCSCFPKDYEYRSYDLIMFWMAHGLLQPTNEKEEPEHIGELYVKRLVSASLLQIDDRCSDPFGTAMGFYVLKMHDLVHDLAKSTMKETNKPRTIIASRLQQASPVEWTNEEFKDLKVLYLKGMKLCLLPDDCFAKMNHLRYLDLSSCNNLERLPDSICKLQMLQSLGLDGCSKLQELPKSMKNLISLRNLQLTIHATSLSSIDIGCLQQLQLLVLANCINLVSLPSALGRMNTLKNLVIFGCGKLENFDDEKEEGKPHGAVQDVKLQAFVIAGSPKLEALPKWLQKSSKTLRYMIISDIGLKTWPEWLPNLTSLDRLRVYNCRGLSSLPNNMDQLCSLQYLYIFDCPKLTARCKEDGPDWPKVARVPHREIN